LKLFLRFKIIYVYLALTAFLGSSASCGHRPAYLKEGKTAEVSERWRVKKIDPALLSADEKSVLEEFGRPDYIRFYRKRSLEREKVYAWVYAEPVRFVTFIDGNKVDYAVLDEDLSSLNEHQRNMLFWGGIAAGSLAAVGLVVFYFATKE
jgi:hypothetical protein